MIGRSSCLILTMLALAACAPEATPPAATTKAPAAASTSATPAAVLKTYPVNAEGFIQHWLLLDPIPLEGVGEHNQEVEKPMFAKEYFKNQFSGIPKDNDKVAIAGKELVWHKVKATDFQIDLLQFATDHGKDPNNCLFLGFTYIIAPDDIRNVKLAIGSDDSSAWWLNGEQVISVYMGRAVNPDDDYSKAVTLKKGYNVLRFAVIQGDAQSGACARFYDAADKPLTGIQVSADTQ